MADIADVELAVLSAVTGALYPLGIQAPSTTGAIYRIYRGWPIPANLNSDLNAGTVNVTVSPDRNQGKTTTRYAPIWRYELKAPSLSVSVLDHAIIFSGSVSTGIAVGLRVDQNTYTYRPKTQDSPSIIAAILAAQIQVNRIALLSGQTITIPGATILFARVVSDGIAIQEVRRQQRDIRVISWCPSPAARDMSSSTIDAALSAMTFIPLRDGTKSRLIYSGTEISDQSQNALLYRRDLIYTAEYPAMISTSAAGMLFGNVGLNDLDITI